MISTQWLIIQQLARCLPKADKRHYELSKLELEFCSMTQDALVAAHTAFISHPTLSIDWTEANKRATYALEFAEGINTEIEPLRISMILLNIFVNPMQRQLTREYRTRLAQFTIELLLWYQDLS
jgi:hypothetical protein